MHVQGFDGEEFDVFVSKVGWLGVQLQLDIVALNDLVLLHECVTTRAHVFFGWLVVFEFKKDGETCFYRKQG